LYINPQRGGGGGAYYVTRTGEKKERDGRHWGKSASNRSPGQAAAGEEPQALGGTEKGGGGETPHLREKKAKKCSKNRGVSQKVNPAKGVKSG